MRAVIQRCLSPAEVRVDNQVKGRIEKGLIVLLGIEETDDASDISLLARKIIQCRIFNDNAGKMNLSVQDEGGGLLIISQFTLHASVRKGNRPSFIKAAKPEFAEKMYEQFIDHIKHNYTIPLASGVFGGDMKVSLINDGPVTIYIDTKNID